FDRIRNGKYYQFSQEYRSIRFMKSRRNHMGNDCPVY
ncbi:hypothetical protein SPYSS1447_2030, partial [Streptococcus pyogenes SS1447]